MSIQPFQTVIDINDGIKEYWEEEYGSPPYGHAEESSLKSFSRRIGVDAQEAIALLEAKGYVVETQTQTLKEIGEKNNIPPKVIYDTIKPKEGTVTANKTVDVEVTFLGRRTLEELAGMDKINLEKSLLFLEEKKANATAQSRMKDAADELETTPYELFEQLKTL